MWYHRLQFSHCRSGKSPYGSTGLELRSPHTQYMDWYRLPRSNLPQHSNGISVSSAIMQLPIREMRLLMSQTTLLSDYPSLRLPFSQTTLLSDYPSLRLPFSQTTLLSDYPSLRLPFSQTTLLSDYPSLRLPFSQTTPVSYAKRVRETVTTVPCQKDADPYSQSHDSKRDIPKGL
ncbi:hypothetical protein DFJ77DRAFT_323861 [Powellomyces hirtus]|nr:hypothetical protein DFJ77DRAFT_323861 [Powellomyces hirtus]